MARRRRRAGLTLLEAPGNDAVSSSALAAAGANLVLFTTGRGTPLGFPVPTLKVASNHTLAEAKPHWIDFDASQRARRRPRKPQPTPPSAADSRRGQRRANAPPNAPASAQIAIWKRGVTL